MSLSVGGIDIPKTLIDCEWRIMVLERLVEKLAQVSPPGTVTPEMFAQIRKEAFVSLQQKYPQAGLTLQ